MQDSLQTAEQLCAFITEATTPFHAVKAMRARLEEAGYSALPEAEDWQLAAGGRYFVTRNDSSLIAFELAAQDPLQHGLRMVGAHTDSPCLKVKPSPEIQQFGYLQLGVEVYGGVLLNPWFDRDLSLAGRVAYQDSLGKLASALIDYRQPVATVPSLAIHLDREVNKQRSINAQQHLPPVMLQLPEEQKGDFRGLLLQRLLQEHPGLDVDAVLDYELCFYDSQAPAIIGLQQDFIAAARLDNLLSCFIGLKALLESPAGASKLLVCTDHEEVGSASAAGASGPFLAATLQRLSESLGDYSPGRHQRLLSASTLISVDNAHAIHPNYADRHDNNHGPRMNAGPVIKYNANQRYASNSESAALFRKLCAGVDVPCQSFVVRTDMGCGSTIGPLIATELGVDTVDVGVPTLGMHSIRELAGSRDPAYLDKVLQAYFGGAS